MKIDITVHLYLHARKLY